MFHLENVVKEKYGLKGLEIVANQVDDSPSDLEQRLAQSAAGMLRGMIDDNAKVGFSWGKSLSLLVEHSGSRHLNNVHFFHWLADLAIFMLVIMLIPSFTVWLINTMGIVAL